MSMLPNRTGSTGLVLRFPASPGGSSAAPPVGSGSYAWLLYPFVNLPVHRQRYQST